MPYTDFHYTPTGTGVISGKEVLEQTEDAINDLGTQISGDVQTAIDTANNALNTATTASADAQNAVNTANTAYTTATNAQNTANTAQNTASNALTAAQTAQNDVNALGNRVTTAENNITQNTTDISGLTTRMTTAEGNITTLQNDVITAQGTATSAQNTATLARGQAYVVRYANVAVSDNSTVPYANLNNTDNIKANDLLLDTDGKIYQISSVDTANETVSVTTPLTQLAVDSSVMHLSGNETADGNKKFLKYITSNGSSTGDEYSSDARTNLWLIGNQDTEEVSGVLFDTYRQNTAQGTGIHILGLGIKENSVRYEGCRWGWYWDNNLNGYTFDFKPTTQGANQAVKHNLGTSIDKWDSVYSLNYYYGSNNTEFSDKFVTTDTAQTIGGVKTFSDIPVFGSFDGIRFRCAHNSSAYITFRNANQANPGSIILSANDGTTGTAIHLVDKTLIPYTSGDIDLGTTSRKWKSLNGLNPGSLSLPDLNNGIDISGYINTGDSDNSYTPLADGYISVRINSTNSCGIYALQGDVYTSSYGNIVDVDLGGFICSLFIPVIKNVACRIICRRAQTVVSAKFYPCQGNV